jgi:hypothetical protein
MRRPTSYEKARVSGEPGQGSRSDPEVIGLDAGEERRMVLEDVGVC